MSSTTKLDVPPALRRTFQPTEDDWIASAERSIELLCRVRGVARLGRDLGARRRLRDEDRQDAARARHADRSLRRCGRVARGHRLPARERRRPTIRVPPRQPPQRSVQPGRPLARRCRRRRCSRPAKFDVITLVSVFTHLGPRRLSSDAASAAPQRFGDTRLCYTAFIDELTEGGHGLIDNYSRIFGDRWSAGRTIPATSTSDDPLRQALYTKDYFCALMTRTGWLIESIAEPTPYIQHYFVCRPVAR